MMRTRRFLGRLHAPLLAIALIAAAGAGVVQAQDESGFPESHAMIMGSGSYAVFFGPVPAVPAGPPTAAPVLPGPPPQVGSNVVVNDPQFPFPNGLLGRSETTIASDPSGQFLLVGWNDADGFCGPPFNVPCVPAIPTGPGLNGFGYSSDGGQTWTDGGAPFAVVTPGGTKVTRADPWMDTGGPGEMTYYFANLGTDTTTTNPGFGGILVHTGDFNSGSFSFNNGVFIPQPNPLPLDFLDKEALCAGKSGFNKNAVAVTVTNFVEIGGMGFAGFGQIEAYVSGDRAASFPTRTLIQPDETVIPVVNQGSTCVYGPGGELYVTWERGFTAPFNAGPGVVPEIYFSASFDGGASFGPRTLVSGIAAPGLFPPGGYNRGNYNEFPRIAVARGGPFKGRVYVAYQSSEIANGGIQGVAPPGPEDAGVCALIFGAGVDCGHPDGDAYIRFSDDGGATWSAPVLAAGGGDGLLQIWPAVSVQADGDVVVTYYQSAETTVPDFLDLDGLGTSLVDVYTVTSTDGGATFGPPLRITEVTTDWGATASNIVPNFGDYIFTASVGNKDLVTWADGRNGVPDTFFAKVKTK